MKHRLLPSHTNGAKCLEPLVHARKGNSIPGEPAAHVQDNQEIHDAVAAMTARSSPSSRHALTLLCGGANRQHGDAKNQQVATGIPQLANEPRPQNTTLASGDRIA